MSGQTFLCSTPDRCEKHGKELHGYPCWDCQQEWRKANPRTAGAITKFAARRGSARAVQVARAADQAARNEATR